MRYAFVREHRRRWPVAVCCSVLGVSRSGYYRWTRRSPSKSSVRRERLTSAIHAVHTRYRRVYGSPRVAAALKLEGGEHACRNTVAKLMRHAGLRGRSPRRFVPRTTDSSHARPIAPNLLKRDFAATRAGQKWVADLTYIPTDEGWLYLAAVLDCHSRKIVGWSMSASMAATLVADALSMALGRRPPDGPLIHHSDRGSQYASEDYQAVLTRRGITPSMSRRGDCYDNAMMESFWSTLKTELVDHRRYPTRDAARLSIFEYIETFYNRQRLHSALGYLSPEAFEAA